MQNPVSSIFSSYSFINFSYKVPSIVGCPLPYYKTQVVQNHVNIPNKNDDVFVIPKCGDIKVFESEPRIKQNQGNRVNHLFPGGLYNQLVDKRYDCIRIWNVNAYNCLIVLVICDIENVTVDGFLCRIISPDELASPNMSIRFTTIERWEAVRTQL